MRRAKRRVRGTRPVAGRGERFVYPRRVATCLPRPVRADRASLLLGTALASTFLIGSVFTATPAHAAFDCIVGPPPAPASPGPISATGVDDSIICVNTEARENGTGDAIDLSTVNNDHYISLTNSGVLTASNAGSAGGIFTQTNGSGSFIDILNNGGITAATTGYGAAYGIYAGTQGLDSTIEIENHGDITVTRDGPLGSGRGIEAYASQSAIGITNTGTVIVTTNGDSSTGYGLSAYTDAASAPIGIGNSGGITVTTSGNFARAYGIYTFARRSAIDIVNSGDINITTSGEQARAYGMSAATTGNEVTSSGATVGIDNTGNITVATSGREADAFGMLANTSYGDVDIDNAGTIVVTTSGDGAQGFGLHAYTFGSGAPIRIDNVGDITVTTSGDSIFFYGTYIDANAFGIRARARQSAIVINSAGAIVVETTGDRARAYGMFARTNSISAPIGIDNVSNITVSTQGAVAYGIYAHAAQSAIGIVNAGDIAIAAGQASATGISARTDTGDSSIGIQNSGDVTVAGDLAQGIRAVADGATAISNSGSVAVKAGDGDSNFVLGIVGSGYSTLSIVNSGNLAATVGNGTFARATGISGGGDALTAAIVNSGDIMATVGDGDTAIAEGIRLISPNGSVQIRNSGDLTLTAGTGDRSVANGLVASTIFGANSIVVLNDGAISATANGFESFARGITATASPGQEGASIEIRNGGDIAVNAPKAYAFGIAARSYGATTPIEIHNSGAIAAKAKINAFAIYGSTAGTGSAVTLVNTGDVTANGENAAGLRAQAQDGAITISNSGSASATGANSYGILARNFGLNPITIGNSGTAFGGTAGIYAFSNAGTTIVNSGYVSGQSLLAIQTAGSGNAEIFNTGTITGFVLLDADDTFVNQAGGTFEARKTSDFDATGPGGDDLFRNEAGGTVHTADDITRAETTRFVNLERFENQGLISLVDNKPGDNFTISNTPGGTHLKFAASGNSRLAVDAFLGGPSNSSSDTFTIEGDVSGVTTVAINNTHQGPGVFNPSGMRVVTVTGATPNPDAFKLDESIDTGFFNYDLFFTPTGSGFWNLRGFPGGGAYLLPQLVTAAQDIWHQSASTWFDRTADLRVLLAGGPAPTAYDPGGKSLGAAEPYALTPAVWARGSGSWLDRDDTARTTAYGRDYTFDMDRDLQTLDFQVGVDLGKRDALTQGDALVFGLLGGLVHGDLDYDALARNFNFDGGQVGVYATYLNGGLFVDTLANVHLYSLETSTLGFPNALDANTVGLRTDTGYRFGSFSGGPFLEPLATIEVTWADIDGFSLGGNTVSFDDDANVRGRLGLRAGTAMDAWEGTLMEPFVTGSLWGNLTDDNSATLVSTGRTFRFEDRLDDVWGEVSAGVNVFNFSQTTAVFAKVDVTFGDDLTGVGGKAGMRVNW